METLIYYYNMGDKKYLVYVILFRNEIITLSQEEVNTLLVGKIGLSTEKRHDIKYFEDLKDYQLMKTTQFIVKSDSFEIQDFVDSCPPNTLICSFQKMGKQTRIMPL